MGYEENEQLWGMKKMNNLKNLKNGNIRYYKRVYYVVSAYGSVL